MSDLPVPRFMFHLGSKERMVVTSDSENFSLDSGGYNPPTLMSNNHVEKGIF